MLEPSGKLSVVRRSQARPVTPKDLGVATQYEGLTNRLVADGKVDKQTLKKIGLDEPWVLGRLAEHDVGGPEEVLFASLDTQGQLLVVRRQDVPFLQAMFKGVQSQNHGCRRWWRSTRAASSMGREAVGAEHRNRPVGSPGTSRGHPG